MNELEKKKKINKLKEIAEAASKTVGSMGKDLLEKKNKTNKVSLGDRDAQTENQTAKRYEKVGVSPIYSKGNFSRNSKELDEKYGNRLTEDDKVPASRKKRK